ncbi:MAG: hypothetical protein M0Z91_07875 [Actinomycetota bacterium]|jgi:polyhydroxyalkanoate synthesis regulator phasin|nr:hypothetical protein [Actinomycetota bacterium]
MATKDQKDRYKKFVDAGRTVTKVTSERVEEVARDLVHLTEVQRAQAQELLDDVMKRSKKSTEYIVETVKHEVDKQFKNVKFASRDDLAKVSETLSQMKSDIASLASIREELRNDVMRLSEAVAHLVVAVKSGSAHKEEASAESEAAPAAEENAPAPEAPKPAAKPKPAATRRPAARRPRSKPANGGEPEAD